MSLRTLVEIPSFAISTVWKGFSTMASVTSNGPNVKHARRMKLIGTHSGVFHCDEALACFMLQQLPEYSNAEIIRTREHSILDKCDIVVDVGGEYNPKTHRYDHHQKSFVHTLSSVRPDLVKNKFIRLSSAGLVYAHFGMEVLTQLLSKHEIAATSDCLRCLYIYIYDGFVEELDAIDNGVPMYSEGKASYKITTHLGARVSRLNPKWNSPDQQPAEGLFAKAVDLVGEEFTERVLDAATVWWPAREIVKQAMEKRHEIDPSGQIIILAESCPWKDHFAALEEEMGIAEEIKFVLFPEGGGPWRVQAVPIQPDSFICRVFLHKDWRGISASELSEVAGIEGCVFCHSTGFIGGNQTKQGALQMALKSLSASISDRE